MINYIYFGSSQFSYIILEKLFQNNILPQLIITQPPRPKGRGLKEQPTEVGLFAMKNNLPLSTPLYLGEPSFIERIAQIKPDIFIVADYGKKIPKKLLSIPKILPLAIHPSLLPKYRGPAPINWAIINDEKITGITIFKMTEKIDSGDIISQKELEILDTDNATSLEIKLANLATDLLLDTLESIKNATFKLTPQRKDCVSFAPKLKKEDGRINWDTPARYIFNLVRGLSNWPGAYTYFQNKIIKILDAAVYESLPLAEAGTIVKINKDGIFVSTKKDLLQIKKIRPEGKKDMDAYSFVIGHNIKVGDRFN